MLSDERIKFLVEHPNISGEKLQNILGVYNCRYPEQVFKSIHRCVHPRIVSHILGTGIFYNRHTDSFDNVPPAPQYAFDNCIDYQRGNHWVTIKCIEKCSVSSLPKFISDIHNPYIALWLAERRDCPEWICDQIFEEYLDRFNTCIGLYDDGNINNVRARTAQLSYRNMGVKFEQQVHTQDDFWGVAQALAQNAQSKSIIRYFLRKTTFVYMNPNIEPDALWDVINHHERYKSHIFNSIWDNPAATEEMLEAIWTLPCVPGEYRSNGYRMRRDTLSHRRMSVDFMLRHFGEINIPRLKRDWGDDMPEEIKWMIPLAEQ